MNKLTIIGVGQIGSHAGVALRNEGALKVIDFDQVEQKNVLSQAHGKMALRRNKAQSFAQMMQGMFGLKVDAIPHKLTGDNVGQLLGGSDLILDCTDNIAARLLIQGYAKANDIPCLHGALAATGDFARIVWTEHFKADAESVEGEATCEDGATLPFGQVTAANLAVIVQRFLKDGTKISCQISPTSYVRLA